MMEELETKSADIDEAELNASPAELLDSDTASLEEAGAAPVNVAEADDWMIAAMPPVDDDCTLVFAVVVDEVLVVLLAITITVEVG